VILVSSEHVFPYRLRHPEQNFNLANFNGYIYAGEVPPKDMYELLTVKWEIEPNVAVALINIYGGHIYDMKEALSRLHLEKQKFWLLDSSLSDNVIECLEWKGEQEDDNLRMRDTLRQLAVSGFVPIKSLKDPIAKVISENNVGGVVKFTANVIGLRPEVWQQTEFENGIVPATQSMRLVIAKMMKE
jgi:nitrogen fixation protein